MKYFLYGCAGIGGLAALIFGLTKETGIQAPSLQDGFSLYLGLS